MNVVVPCTILFCFCSLIESARILGIFPAATYSHFILGHTLMKELASRGHEVTVMSPYPLQTSISNYKDIDLSQIIDKFDEEKEKFFNVPDIPAVGVVAFNHMVFKVTEYIFKMDNIQAFLKSDQQFDLVILEEFTIYAFLAFCHRFNAPCITFSVTGLSWMTSNQVGNPNSPAYIPNSELPYSNSMNFYQRLKNSFHYVLCEMVTQLYILPRHNKIVQQHFPEAPDIRELYYNISLTLINHHVSTHSSIPLVPNLIDVGGLHIKPPKNLPKDIQDFLDNAREGAVLFSMGSHFKSKDISLEKRDMFLKIFRKLKQKILWKFEDENLPGKPSNLKVVKWLPQADVLAHPNVKVFMTHSGLLSITEAVYHGVPIVGLPVFGDQNMNLAIAENNGIGLGIPLKELTEDKLMELLQKVLNDPKFASTAKKRSNIMRDQPMTPLERGVFWVEYVLRHKGAPHLRTAALHLSWYQYLLLDVMAFTILIALLMFLALRCFVRTFICTKSKISRISNEKKKS